MGTLWHFPGPCHLRGSVSQETIPAKIRHQFRQQIQEEISVSQEETPESKQSSTIILRNSRQPVPPCPDVVSNTELFGLGPCRLFVHLSRNHYRHFGTMWPSSNHTVRQKKKQRRQGCLLVTVGQEVYAGSECTQPHRKSCWREVTRSKYQESSPIRNSSSAS